jgi:hypothetical protein
MTYKVQTGTLEVLQVASSAREECTPGGRADPAARKVAGIRCFLIKLAAYLASSEDGVIAQIINLHVQEVGMPKSGMSTPPRRLKNRFFPQSSLNP